MELGIHESAATSLPVGAHRERQASEIRNKYSIAIECKVSMKHQRNDGNWSIMTTKTLVHSYAQISHHGLPIIGTKVMHVYTFGIVTIFLQGKQDCERRKR